MASWQAKDGPQQHRPRGSFRRKRAPGVTRHPAPALAPDFFDQISASALQGAKPTKLAGNFYFWCGTRGTRPCLCQDFRWPYLATTEAPGTFGETVIAPEVGRATGHESIPVDCNSFGACDIGAMLITELDPPPLRIERRVLCWKFSKNRPRGCPASLR